MSEIICINAKFGDDPLVQLKQIDEIHISRGICHVIFTDDVHMTCHLKENIELFDTLTDLTIEKYIS